MTLSLNIHDEIAAQLATTVQDLPRAALEALAIEGYRRGALTQLHVEHLLGRIQAEDFLAEHLPVYDYDPTELRREAEALAKLSDRSR